MEKEKWKPRRCNAKRRVNTYTNPAVSEVIFRGEWKRKREYTIFERLTRWIENIL